MALTDEEITENRKIAVAALRSNHRSYRQITGRLCDSKDGRCADGLILEAFHVDPFREANAYDILGQLIGTGWPSKIYHMNDTQKLTFRQIADKLAKEWRLQ